MQEKPVEASHYISTNHPVSVPTTQLIISSRSVRGNGGRVEAGDAVYLQVFSKVCWGTRYWRLKQSRPRSSRSSQRSSQSRRRLLFSLILLLISEASMVCVTLDVAAVTTTTSAAVMAPSILWAFISSLARLRWVEDASPGDRGCFLLSSMVPIVTGEIPGPITAVGATRLTPVPCRIWCSRCSMLPGVSRNS